MARNDDNEIDCSECRYWDECTKVGYDMGREDTIFWLREYMVEQLDSKATGLFDKAVEKLKEQKNGKS